MLEQKLLKVIPDFFEYYLPYDIEEYDSRDEFIISRLEHELDMYTNYKEYGFNDKQKVSYINKDNVNKIKNLLNWYYKN